MAGTPPKASQEADESLRQEIMPAFGRMDMGDQGPLVPYGLISPLIESKVGQMRAEMERELSDRLGNIDNKMGSLRDDLGRKPGWGGIWTISGVVVTTALAVLGLVFAFLMHGSDRSETGVQVGMEIGRAIEQQERQAETSERPRLEDAGNSE